MSADKHPIHIPSQTTVIDDLNQQAWELRIADVHQAVYLAEQAQAAAIKTGYQPGQAQSGHILGHCHFRMGDYEQAQSLTLAAQALFQSLGDFVGQSDALNTLGNIHSGLGDHHGAYEYYLQSLKLRQEAGHKQAEAASWNNIGNVHFHLADYENALASHQKSLAIKQEIDDQSGVATSLNNIGNVYKASGDFQNAQKHYTQSLAIFRVIGNQYGEAGALSNLGAIYKEMGDATAALAHHHQSLQIEQAIGNKLGHAESLLQLGQLYTAYPDLPPLPMHDGSTTMAMACVQQALAMATELNTTELLYQVNLTLSQLYEQQGDFSRALAHYQAFHTAARQVFDEERADHTRKLQIMHQVETSKKEAELEHARAELFRLQTIELAQALTKIEEQRRLAEEANRFKTKLLSIAAHDLKNPLGAIYANAGLILTLLPEEDSLFSYVKDIEISTQRMQRLIEELLDSTSIESGQLKLHLEPIDLAVLAQEVLDSHQRTAQHKGQSLQLEAETECFVRADKARLWQVLENLVSNAIKYSPLGKPIWVSVYQENERVCLSVKDEGPGLTLDDQKQLFSSFGRLSAQPTGGESATGFGLSIVKQLVELQEGKVWAESKGPETGSTFFVQMPALGRP